MYPQPGYWIRSSALVVAKRAIFQSLSVISSCLEARPETKFMPFSRLRALGAEAEGDPVIRPTSFSGGLSRVTPLLEWSRLNRRGTPPPMGLCRYPLALSLVSSGRVKLKDLVSHRFRLEEAPEAFRVARSPGALKVVIYC